MHEIVAIFLIAMTPVLELRASIPIALAVYDFPVWKAILVSLAGNTVPVFVLLFFERTSSWLSYHSDRMGRFFAWLFTRTMREHEKKIQRFKEVALVLLVAIPVPVSGAWTAVLVAYLFAIPFRRALPLVLVGLIISATIVTLITLGVITLAF